MAPRKRAHEDDDEVEAGPSNTTATGKKGKADPKERYNATSEKMADAVKRLQLAGIKFKDDNEPEDDPQDRSDDDLDSAWIEHIAQGIVREPEFLKVVGNAPPIEHITIGKKLLSALRLDRRYHRYSSIKTFYEKWWLGTPTNRIRVVQRAIEIYDGAVGIVQTSIAKTKIVPPADDAATSEARVQIFHYQTLRSRITTVLQNVTDQEYILVKRLFAPKAEVNASSTNSVKVVEELNLLEDAKAELRARLSSCVTEATGKSIIDDLLSKISEPGPNIFDLPKDTVESGLKRSDTQTDPSPEPSVPEKIKLIDEFSPYTVLYLDNEDAGGKNVVTVLAPRTKSIPMSEIPQIDALLSADFDALDQKVSSSLAESGRSIDISRFRFNLAHFQSISERPGEVKDAKKRDGIFTNVYKRHVLVEDNLFHVRVLVAQLRQHDLLADGVSDQQLQQCLRRMWALIAIIFGCAPEASLWLTTMDSLLEDLAKLLIGQVDPRMNSAKMQIFQDMRNKGIQPKDLKALPQSDIDKLERADRARQVFAELARFYRGCVVLGYAGVSPTGKMTESTTKFWFDNLLSWTYFCGAPNCVEKLVVHERPVQAEEESKQPETKDEQEEDDLDDGEDDQDDPDELADDEDEMMIDTEETITYRASIGSRSGFNLTVTVNDARMGYPEERAEISENREWAYPCLYELIHFNKWHAGFGPFFHYFGHLYHTPCQPWRGKDNFAMTILATANDQ